MAVAIVAQELDLYPPRVLVSVTGLTLGDDIAVYRSVGGQRTLVRAAEATDVTDTSFVRADGEMPFGVPVTYVAVVNSTTEYAATPATYTLPGGKVALSDAVTGAAAEAVILAWDEKAFAPQTSVFKVGGRNVVVSGDLGMFEGTIELYFDAYASGQNFQALLEQATEGIIQIRTADPAYEGVDCYVAVIDARERRFSQDGSDPRRTWVLQVAETESWSADLEASAFTYDDVATFYGVSGTYADLAGDFATYLAVAQGDYS